MPIHTKAIRPFIWNNWGKSLHAAKGRVCKSSEGRWRCCLMCICFLSYDRDTMYLSCLHTRESGDKFQMLVFHVFCRWCPGCCGRCGRYFRKYWEGFVLYTGPHTGKCEILDFLSLNAWNFETEPKVFLKFEQRKWTNVWLIMFILLCSRLQQSNSSTPRYIWGWKLRKISNLRCFSPLVR